MRATFQDLCFRRQRQPVGAAKIVGIDRASFAQDHDASLLHEAHRHLAGPAA